MLRRICSAGSAFVVTVLQICLVHAYCSFCYSPPAFKSATGRINQLRARHRCALEFRHHVTQNRQSTLRARNCSFPTWLMSLCGTSRSLLKSRPPPLVLPPLLCIKRRSFAGTARVEERFQGLRAHCAGGNTRSLRRTARGPRHAARAGFRPTCSFVPRRWPLCQCVSANVLLRSRRYRCAHALAASRALGICRHHRRSTRRHVASNPASRQPRQPS